MAWDVHYKTYISLPIDGYDPCPARQYRRVREGENLFKINLELPGEFSIS
jgi:hypothetical protein